jgi:hypothetical protein
MFFRTFITYRLEEGLLKLKCAQENRTFLGKNSYRRQDTLSTFFYSEGKQELIELEIFSYYMYFNKNKNTNNF